MGLIHGIIGAVAGIALDRVVLPFPEPMDSPTWVETDSVKAGAISTLLQRSRIDHRMTNEAGPGEVFVVLTKASQRTRARSAIVDFLRPKGAPVPSDIV